MEKEGSIMRSQSRVLVPAVLLMLIAAPGVRAGLIYSVFFGQYSGASGAAGVETASDHYLIKADPGSSAFFRYDSATGAPFLPITSSTVNLFQLSAGSTSTAFPPGSPSQSVESGDFHIRVVVTDTTANDTDNIDIVTNGAGTFDTTPFFSISHTGTGANDPTGYGFVSTHSLMSSLTLGGVQYQLTLQDYSLTPNVTHSDTEAFGQMNFTMTITGPSTTAVPAPPSLILFGSGLPFFGWTLVRRRLCSRKA
jgi:hypothetical protein